MDSLIYFGVQGCSKLKKIPEFSGQMENLSMLSLSGTPIEKLPSSIGRLLGLTFLDVSNCENLLGLPSEICNLKSLEVLCVDGCSYSDKRPQNRREVGRLMLQMHSDAIKQSGSTGNLRYHTLFEHRYHPNKSRFWWGLQRKAFVLGSLHGLWSLKGLDLSDCSLCEGDIPVDFCCLPFLEELDLSRNNFVSLPASIGCLSKLRSFWVNGCQMLQQLPHLRFGLVENEDFCSIQIYTDDCTSLKMLPKFGRSDRSIKLSCVNCFGLVENEGCNDSQLLEMLRIAMGRRRVLQVQRRRGFQIVIPGSRIPEWFNNQSVGDSLIVELPPCTTPIWIALCAVIEEDYPNPPHDLSKIFEIRCRPFFSYGLYKEFYIKRRHLVSPHLWVSCFSYVKHTNRNQMKISVETLSHIWVPYGDSSRRIRKIYWPGIKKCGFRLVHDEDLEELNQIMMMNHSINISTKATSPHNSADANGSSHQKSLCRRSYALSKRFLTKLVKIFSLFLTTAVFINSFNNSKQWGRIGLLIWSVTTLISHLGLAPSYFSLLLKSLIKTVILKRAAKFLRPLSKTPAPQISAHKYSKG